MATEDFWGGFRRWRRSRPFWGGLFLLLSGLFLFLSSNLSVFTELRLDIHIGPQGFLSYVLPALMLICGVLVWLTPAQRMFYGIVGLLTALYSFIGLNFGGWVLGMLSGIVGGALVVSWSPRADQLEAPDQGPSGMTGPDHQDPPSPGDQHHGGPGESTQVIQLAGHDDRPHDTAPLRAPVQSDPSILPGFGEPHDGEQPPASGQLPGARRGLNRKALAIITVPAFVGATFLIGSRLPASADDCPAGLPSISTSVSAPSSSPASAKPDPSVTKTAAAATAGSTKGAEPATSASASASASAEAGGGSSILEDVVDGLGNLLGLGDDETPATPSVSPSTSATGSAPATADPATTTTAPAGGATSATSAPSQAASSAAADDDVIPCLGARQEGLVADDGGIPKSAIKPGIMKVDSLTMYDSTYEGVADVPTRNGVIKSLQFNMKSAVNKPFSLTISEPGGAVTTIKSAELTTTGNVRFYTPKFTGNLFGIIPVTFTPEQPPPLTLPILWFTNVTIDLAYVRCDTLTADPFKITES